MIVVLSKLDKSCGMGKTWLSSLRFELLKHRSERPLAGLVIYFLVVLAFRFLLFITYMSLCCR